MNKIIAAIAAVVLLAASCNQNIPTTYNDGTVELSGQVVNIDIVSTDAERAQGLSGRPALQPNEGMLFTFETNGKPNFWMKDMNFSIDIVWIRDNKVIDVVTAKNQPGAKQSDLILYTPKEDVNMVLELSEGWAKTNSLKMGDEIKIRTN